MRGAAFAGVLAIAAGCSTHSLVTDFNKGILDSVGDPCRDPIERRRTLVHDAIVHEFMDAFFSQGRSDGDVEKWLRQASSDTGELVLAIHGEACALGNNLGIACGDDGSVAPDRPYAATQLTSRDRFRLLGERWRGASAAKTPPICDEKSKLRATEAAHLADSFRFDAAIGRTVGALTGVAIERLVDMRDVKDGAHRAFVELAAYLERRQWHRTFDRRVGGVVIKGGASTGLYSGGVVWTALNLIQACMANAACRAVNPDPRFVLSSGTSTGAMIAVAVERFNVAPNADEQKKALDDFIKWFTCQGVADLYCVRENESALAMLNVQKGMVEFDGIEKFLKANVDERIFHNGSELVLNTVDFRTGTLWDLSDANELRTPNDIVQSAIASAVEPFVAAPVGHLPVDYEPLVEHTYLDGGIRAELPILPLARRGAERVLVVSSSASVTDESSGLASGLNIAERYIDVSTGGVTESEIAHAERHVEAVRIAEMDACASAKTTEEACAGNADCVRAFCDGNWEAVCVRGNATDLQASAKSPRAALDLTNARLKWLWGTRSFFRNEVEVEPLHGYNFDPKKQRELFLAGAEQARERCNEIAQILGIPEAMIRGELKEACARPVLTCQSSTQSTTLRTCTSPPPPVTTGLCR